MKTVSSLLKCGGQNDCQNDLLTFNNDLDLTETEEEAIEIMKNVSSLLTVVAKTTTKTICYPSNRQFNPLLRPKDKFCNRSHPYSILLAFWRQSSCVPKSYFKKSGDLAVTGTIRCRKVFYPFEIPGHQICNPSHPFKFLDNSGWMKNQLDTSFILFVVAHRVSKILDSSSSSKWRHIPGDTNPADDCSRGIPATHLTPQHR